MAGDLSPEKPKIMRDERGRVLPGSVLNPTAAGASSPPKVPLQVKEMIEEAASLAGQDVVTKKILEADPNMNERAARRMARASAVDYLREQAHKNPVAFLSLLGKVLPRQLDVNLQITTAETISLMQARRDLLASRRAEVLEAREDEAGAFDTAAE